MICVCHSKASRVVAFQSKPVSENVKDHWQSALFPGKGAFVVQAASLRELSMTPGHPTQHSSLPEPSRAHHQHHTKEHLRFASHIQLPPDEALRPGKQMSGIPEPDNNVSWRHQHPGDGQHKTVGWAEPASARSQKIRARRNQPDFPSMPPNSSLAAYQRSPVDLPPASLT